MKLPLLVVVLGALVAALLVVWPFSSVVPLMEVLLFVVLGLVGSARPLAETQELETGDRERGGLLLGALYGSLARAVCGLLVMVAGLLSMVPRAGIPPEQLALGSGVVLLGVYLLVLSPLLGALAGGCGAAVRAEVEARLQV